MLNMKLESILAHSQNHVLTGSTDSPGCLKSTSHANWLSIRSILNWISRIISAKVRTWCRRKRRFYNGTYFHHRVWLNPSQVVWVCIALWSSFAVIGNAYEATDREIWHLYLSHSLFSILYRILFLWALMTFLIVNIERKTKPTRGPIDIQWVFGRLDLRR